MESGLEFSDDPRVNRFATHRRPMNIPEYDHTQKGWWHWVLHGMAVLVLALGWNTPAPQAVIVLFAALFVLLGLCFAHLTVRDGGDVLELRYGPLALFRKDIPYAEIRAVEKTRSDILDGGGIHYVPGRGWIYNLWGLDCVRITLEGRSTRVGSDDAEGLAAFLEGRITRE